MNKITSTCFLVSDQEHVAASQALKATRTNLLSILSSYPNRSKTICFTSPEEGSGCTFSCVNIAASFANMGAKVLLIDTDLRNPSANICLDIIEPRGLSDVLGEQYELEKAVSVCSKVKNLFVLPAGTLPHNPTELLLSEKFNTILKELEAQYDYIFIDTPPVCSFTDAAIISRKTLGTILVCKSGHTKFDVAQKAQHILEQGGGKILGTILNGISTK